MERIYERNKSGVAQLKDVSYANLQTAFEQGCQFEEKGLNPEKFESMKAENEVLKQLAAKMNLMDLVNDNMQLRKAMRYKDAEIQYLQSHFAEVEAERDWLKQHNNELYLFLVMVTADFSYAWPSEYVEKALELVGFKYEAEAE